MQCAAIAAHSKKRCRKPVSEGYRYCSYHRNALRSRGQREGAGAGDDRPGPESRALMNPLSDETGVGDEITLLRYQIRVAYEMGDTEAVRRGIDTLCKALRVQHVLAGRPAEGISGSIARVLDEIGNELGIPL